MSTDYLLAIETSQRQGSVALARDAAILGARTLSAERRNAGELLPAIQTLLADAEVPVRALPTCAWSCGPGSFTGLRIAATICRVLQSVAGCRVVAVPTMDVLAANVAEDPPARLATVIDAGRGQVYGGLFERRDDALTAVHPAGIFDPASWLGGIEQPVHALGPGLVKHAERVAAAGATVLPAEVWQPRAERVAEVGVRLAAEGRVSAPDEIVPLYVRPPECEEVYEARRAAARQKRGEDA